MKVKEAHRQMSLNDTGFPGGSDGKESACNAGDPGSIPGLGRSTGEGNGYPPQYSCLENPMQRNLVGYSPWGHKELDTTEQLTFSRHSFKKKLWSWRESEGQGFYH